MLEKVAWVNLLGTFVAKDFLVAACWSRSYVSYSSQRELYCLQPLGSHKDKDRLLSFKWVIWCVDFFPNGGVEIFCIFFNFCMWGSWKLCVKSPLLIKNQRKIFIYIYHGRQNPHSIQFIELQIGLAFNLNEKKFKNYQYV